MMESLYPKIVKNMVHTWGDVSIRLSKSLRRSCSAVHGSSASARVRRTLLKWKSVAPSMLPGPKTKVLQSQYDLVTQQDHQGLAA